jgi:hypothetical protein
MPASPPLRVSEIFGRYCIRDLLIEAYATYEQELARTA